MALPDELNASHLVVFAGLMSNRVSVCVACVYVRIDLHEERQRFCRAMFCSVVNGSFRSVICCTRIEMFLVNEILENVGMVVHRTEMSGCLTEIVLSMDVTTYGRRTQSIQI